MQGELVFKVVSCTETFLSFKADPGGDVANKADDQWKSPDHSAT